MEKKDRPANICRGCGSYEVYYKKYVCNFYRERLGYCREHQRIVAETGSCESWRKLHNRSRHAVTLQDLDKIISDIAVIRQICGEEKNDGR